MSYEIPGFDPTALQDDPDIPFGVWHQTINGVDVHVVHPQEFYRRFDAGQHIELVDHQTAQRRSNMQRVTACERGGTNYDGQPASIYDASIELRKEQDWTKEFDHWLSSGSYMRLAVEKFYWNNTRLLRRPGTNLIMQSTVHSRRIVFTNQTTDINGADPLKTTRLSAPRRADVEVGEQFVHALDCITAMMCVADSLNKNTLKSPGGVLIATPDGPLHKNPDTGEYVHRLGREQVTVAPVKKPEQPKRTLDQFFGIEDIKEQLTPIILFYTRPELAAKWHVKRPGNVLFYGPAGTGKTTIVQALANEIDANLHTISPADIYGKWMGESEKAIQAIFNKVRAAKKPTVLLFDEMEGIVNVVDSDSSGSRATNAVAGIFKTESAKVSDENPNVIIAATTNDPERLDPALIRAGRFDMQIAIGLPGSEARRQMFGNLILNYHSLDVGEFEPVGASSESRRFNPYSPDLLENESLTELAQQTSSGFSAADIIEVLRRAALAKARQEAQGGTEPPPIDLAFLIGIVTSMRRSRA